MKSIFKNLVILVIFSFSYTFDCCSSARCFVSTVKYTPFPNVRRSIGVFLAFVKGLPHKEKRQRLDLYDSLILQVQELLNTSNTFKDLVKYSQLENEFACMHKGGPYFNAASSSMPMDSVSSSSLGIESAANPFDDPDYRQRVRQFICDLSMTKGNLFKPSDLDIAKAGSYSQFTAKIDALVENLFFELSAYYNADE